MYSTRVFDYYTGSFTRKFRAFLKECGVTDDIVELGWFTTSECNTSNDDVHWRLLKRFIRALKELADYSTIVYFVYYVLGRPSEFDVPRLMDVLSDIPVRENYTLAELCQEFYANFAEPGECSQGRNFMPRSECLYLPGFLLTKVYGVEVRADNITLEHIERIRRMVLSEIEQTEKKRKEEVQRKNKERRALHWPLEVYLEPSIQDHVRFVPGQLYPICCYAEMEKPELCGKLLNDYVFPAFANIKWEEDSLTTKLMTEQLDEYTSILRSLLSSMYHSTGVQLAKESFARKLIEELLDEYRNAKSLSERLELQFPIPIKLTSTYGFSNEYPAVGQSLVGMLGKGKRRIREVLSEDKYSFVLSVTPFLLAFSGHEMAVPSYLLEYMDEIPVKNRLNQQMTKLLSMSIKITKDLPTASSLYGYFAYDTYLHEREKRWTIQFLQDAVSLVEQVKDYIYKTEKRTTTTEELWGDVIFANNHRYQYSTAINSQLEKGELPDYIGLQWWFRLLEAFSRPNGINPNAIEIEDPDGWGEYNLIPRNLQIACASCVEQSESIDVWYASFEGFEKRKQLDVLLQTHLAELQEKTILERISLIADLKKEIREGDEETIQKIEQVTQRLHRELLISGQSLAYFRSEIESSQRTFLRRNPQLNMLVTLKQKVPKKLYQEVMNYLITSEKIYRCLSVNEKDNQTIQDYSPAVLSLTKALELTLHHIYSKMKVTVYDGIPENVKKQYFWNLTPQKKLTLGPYINLLSDSRYINYDIDSGKLYYEREDRKRGKYEKPHFIQWGGDDVIDTQLLSSFQHMGVLVARRSPKDLTSVSLCFTDDADYNRMLLAKGLDYIREKFRNNVAHKDPVTKVSVDECREIMLSSKHLLWILLAIIKDTD